jgi:hypothetical protein
VVCGTAVSFADHHTLGAGCVGFAAIRLELGIDRASTTFFLVGRQGVEP